MTFLDRHPVIRAVVIASVSILGGVLFVGLLLMAWWMIEVGCGGFCP